MLVGIFMVLYIKYGKQSNVSIKCNKYYVALEYFTDD